MKKKNKEKAFTLIELLVIAIIISLLSALTLTSFRVGERQFALENSAHQLSRDLRKAQELSMSAKSYTCPSGWQMKGYGIKLNIDDDFYLLKARCEEIANPGSFLDQTVGDQIMLKEGVKIKELKRDGVTVDTLSIFFYPPQPDTDFGGQNNALLTLSLKTNTSISKNVSVNKSGLIAIE